MKLVQRDPQVSATAGPAPAPSLRRLQRLLAERPAIALAGLLALLVAISSLLIPGYLKWDQLTNILRLGSVMGLLAAGQTMIIISGGIDLSVAWIAVAAGYVVAYVAAGSSVPAGIAAALALGLLIGAINGIGVGVFEASPLIVTLGMAGVVQGGVIVFDKAHLANAPGVPAVILQLANNSIGGRVPIAALVWIAVAALVITVLHRTGLGRVIYAVGDNKEACRLAGIPVAGVLVAVYALAGLVSASGGILLVGLSRYANAQMGDPFLLPSIAAVVVGGSSIAGGSGGYGGTILGVLLLTVLDGLLTLLNIGSGQAPQAARFILYGAIVLLLAWTYIRASQQA
jgi:ribose transport system permease protein